MCSRITSSDCWTPWASTPRTGRGSRDAGHWPQWEKVDEYLNAHREFLLLGKDPS
jgi:hypothetical protein